MQAGRADSRNRAKGNRRYADDKPRECRYCYFWKGKIKGCSQEECYYLLPEENPALVDVPGNLPAQEISRNGGGGCQGCPYGRHSPCIGYCLKKILREMKEKKQSSGKEGERLAGRSK